MAVAPRFNKYLYPTVMCVIFRHGWLRGKPVPVYDLVNCMREWGYRGMRNIYAGLNAAVQDGYIINVNSGNERPLYVPTLLGAVDAGIYMAVVNTLYGGAIPSPETARIFISTMRGVVFWAAVREFFFSVAVSTMLRRLGAIIARNARNVPLEFYLRVADEYDFHAGFAIDYSMIIKALTEGEVKGLPKDLLANLIVDTYHNTYYIVYKILSYGIVSLKREVEDYLHKLVGEGQEKQSLINELMKTLDEIAERAKRATIPLAYRFARSQLTVTNSATTVDAI
ncbi:MAG: hypothetical protein RXQ94_05115 [Caldivirga sp.]